MFSAVNRQFISRFLGLFIIPMSLLGQSQAAGAKTSDTLAFFQEEAQVVTASRFEQPISEAPMSIHVITSEEIAASGAVNFWDLMRFAPGMDVYDSRTADGNRAVVSVRGFPSAYVGNLQVLIDGRSIYSPITGGVTWQEIPVQIQDVERIEIARGSNAALYGSNAALGTINIITKRPGKRSVSVRSLAGNLGTESTSASVEDASGKLGVRVSGGHSGSEGFQTTSGTDGNDHQVSDFGNFRSFWSPREGTNVEAMAGAVSSDYHLRGFLGPLKTEAGKHFEMAKVSQAIGSSHVDLLVSHQRSATHSEGSLDVLDKQLDVEAQHRFGWLDDRVQTTWGASHRESVVGSDKLFASDPSQENRIWRGFTQQNFKVTGRLTLNGAFSYEKSDTGGDLIAYQMASLYCLTPLQILRLSYALAPTLPDMFSKRADFQASPVAHLQGNPALDASKVKSVELGHQGYFYQRRLETNVNINYATLSNLPVTVTQVTFFPTFEANTTYRNGNRAQARGAEAALKYRFDRDRSAYINYTYVSVSDDAGNKAITKAVPEHKLNIGGIAGLGHGFTASMNAGYKDSYLASGDIRTADVSAYWRLDARLAYAIKMIEIFVAGQNLTRPEKVEAADGLAVPRTYQAGVTLSFGGTK